MTYFLLFSGKISGLVLLKKWWSYDIIQNSKNMHNLLLSLHPIVVYIMIHAAVDK